MVTRRVTIQRSCDGDMFMASEYVSDEAPKILFRAKSLDHVDARGANCRQRAEAMTAAASSRNAETPTTIAPGICTS